MEKMKEAYAKLYRAVFGEGHMKYKEEEVCSFVAMKGSEYDNQDEVRFMLVGRATNGWGKILSTDSEQAFSSDAKARLREINRFEKEWKMKDCKGNPYSEYKDKDGNIKKYFLSHSRFWNYSREVWERITDVKHKPDWFNCITWSNIYKIAPEESGNPSTNLIFAQAESCVEILKEEIKILKPTHILLVIDEGWIAWKSRKKCFNFMEAFEDYEECNAAVTKNQCIVQRALKKGKTKVLVTCRPENRKKEEYVNEVVNAFALLEK